MAPGFWCLKDRVHATRAFALSAYRPCGTRALRSPDSQESLDFVVGFARRQREHLRSDLWRVRIRFGNRHDLRRTVGHAGDRVAVGPRQRRFGLGVCIRCWGRDAFTRPLAHGAIGFLDQFAVAAVDLNDGLVTRKLAAMVLATRQTDPEAGQPRSNEDQNGQYASHGWIVRNRPYLKQLLRRLGYFDRPGCRGHFVQMG